MPDHDNKKNQTEQPDSVKDNSPDDITPDRHSEQQNARQRLVATVRSLKKQKQRLKAAQDTLRIRWSKVLNTAVKYGGNRPTKSYPKRKLLPEFDEEAFYPPNQKLKQPSGRIDDLTANMERQATPHISQYAVYARAHIKRRAKPDPSMDHASVLQHTMQHNKHPNNTVNPDTGVPHTPYVSPMRCRTMNFQRDSNP